MFGAKGPASFLAKATFGLALAFVINTLTMGYLYNQDKNQSVADTISTTTAIPKAVDINKSTTVPLAVDTNKSTK
jgi:preprotein translocase subunit SecG